MGLTPITSSDPTGQKPIDRVSGDQHARVFALIGAARRTGYATGEFFFVDVARSMPLHVVDMTVEWGVMIFVRGGESANTRTDSRPGLAPRPRRLLMRRDASAVFVWVDDNTTTLLGWTNDDLLGTPATKLIHPDDLDRAVEGWLSMLGGADSEPTRLRYRDVSGAYRWFEVHNTSHLADPALAYVESELIDIDAEMTALAKVRDTELQFSTLTSSLPVGVLQLNSKGDVAFANEWMHELTGCDDSTIRQLEWMPLESRVRFATEVQAALGSGEDSEIEVEVTDAHGEARVCRFRIRSVSTMSKRLGVIASVEDITDSLALQQQLKVQALTDPLTELPNRRALHEWLIAQEGGTSVALFFIDLDQFKIVNDGMGHDFGDELLAAVAELIRQYVRPNDFVARLGGDEFVVGSVGIEDRSQAAEIAARILRSLHRPVIVDQRPVSLGCSIGIAIGMVGRTPPHELVSNADLAMYEAKHSGGNRYAFFDPEQRVGVLRRLRHEAEIRTSLNEGRFELYLQPVVELETGATIGFESLVRWNHPELGVLAPAEFIGIAENSGLIHALGIWIVDEACRLSAKLARCGHPSRVSVNVSPVQLATSTFTEVVHQAVARHSIEPSDLVLEVTETVFVEANEQLLMSLNSLVASGIHLAIDDFGTGYSSLNHLRLLPIQVVKIDRSYTAEMETDAGTAAIIQTMIDLSRRLGQQIVVEGIETTSQARLLYQFGVRYGQGYLFGRPAPVAEVLARLGQVSETR